MAIRHGGSFAPKLTAEKVAAYRALAQGCDQSDIQWTMLQLCDMADSFLQTPDSKLEGKPHPSGRGLVVPLEADEVKRIDAFVPWDWECKAYAKLFDTIPNDTQKPL